VTLEEGMERTAEFTVADWLLTDVGGTLGVKVLSTPGMIAMMERCAVEVREGDRTIGVGTHERRVIDRTSFGS
jgi:predicted thioesterase